MSRVWDVLVIGAGAVGLACAAVLARAGRRVLVLERRDGPGQETTSRNSQVVHAGLYYPEGSLKAETCVEGRRLLYARCARLGLPHRRVGKLVVATEPEELSVLEEIRARGVTCGAGALELLDAREVARREPRVRALAALWSPESGIVDAHALVSSYQAEAEALDAAVVFRTNVTRLERAGGLWHVETRGADGDETTAVDVPWVVNAAGLGAERIAVAAGIDTQGLGCRLYLCKGDYFAAAPSLGALTHHLVYPVPAGAGLGIHVTVDLGGRYRFGPDAEYVDRIDYVIEPAKAASFAAAVQRYLPEVRAEHLTPDFAGIRPKLQGPGEPFRDFVVEEASRHGAPGLINLLGIESPGLTASEGIARHVRQLMA